MNRKLNTALKYNILFQNNSLQGGHSLIFANFSEMLLNGNDNVRITKKKSKGTWGRRQSGIFYFFSRVSEKIQMEAARLHVQLSHGICLWFLLHFFLTE